LYNVLCYQTPIVGFRSHIDTQPSANKQYEILFVSNIINLFLTNTMRFRHHTQIFNMPLGSGLAIFPKLAKVSGVLGIYIYIYLNI
jgi:hypothetical protein